MEDAGYQVDVITDTDLHKGFADIGSYPALILTTHPEYWSLEMVDHLQEYLANGALLFRDNCTGEWPETPTARQ